MERYRVTIDPTTSSNSGAGSGTFMPTRSGFLQAIAYTKDDYDGNVTVTVVADDSALTLFAATAGNMDVTTFYLPRAVCRLATTGAAIHYNDQGDEPVVDKVPVIAGEQITVTIAAGGNAKGGTFDFFVG